MSAGRSKFVNKVNLFLDINQLIANANIAVVVKNRPTAAVAVNSDRFIFIKILKILIILLD